MLLKWIVCQVSEEQKESFSEAQASWKKLSDVPGFLGQWGGWNLKEPMEACILSLWSDQESYQTFMSQIHDRIFLNSNQEATYKSILLY